MTGYTEDVIGRAARAGGPRLLHKPIAYGELAACGRAALDARVRAPRQ